MRKRITIVAAAALTLLLLTESASACYSPAKGRFLARDPIGEEGGANLFGFVGNRSPNAIDSTGRRTFVDQDANGAITVTTPMAFFSEGPPQGIAVEDLGTASSGVVKNILRQWNRKPWRWRGCPVSFKIGAFVWPLPARYAPKEIAALSVAFDFVYLRGKSPDRDERSTSYGSIYSGFHRVTLYQFEFNYPRDEFGPEGWVPAHEYGHQLGLDDRYYRNLVHPGWESNIMGLNNGQVEQRNINEVLAAVEDLERRRFRECCASAPS